MEICSKNKDQAKSFEQGRGIETCLSTERAKMKSKKVRNNEPFFSWNLSACFFPSYSGRHKSSFEADRFIPKVKAELDQ